MSLDENRRLAKGRSYVLMVKEMDNWYVFFVKTGQEGNAVKDIVASFGNEATFLNLSVEKLYRKHGQVAKEKHYMFPGYVFFASAIGNDEFVTKSFQCIRKSNYIMRLLHYGDTRHAAMLDDEKEVIKRLWQGNHCIESSKGFIERGRVVVTEGPFAGQESIIKEIRRHKMEAVIELEFMGGVRQITVGLEILANIK